MCLRTGFIYIAGAFIDHCLYNYCALFSQGSVGVWPLADFCEIFRLVIVYI